VTRTLRGRAAVVGIGESVYYKRGDAPDPEFVLACRAILAACADAAIDVTDVDGFASYSNDRNEPSRLAAALGIKELRFSNMQWGSGGGGVAAAVGNAAAAIAAGLADCVVVFRALAQGQFGRFGEARRGAHVSGEAALSVPYGLIYSRCAPHVCSRCTACRDRRCAPSPSPRTITRNRIRAR